LTIKITQLQRWILEIERNKIFASSNLKQEIETVKSRQLAKFMNDATKIMSATLPIYNKTQYDNVVSLNKCMENKTFICPKNLSSRRYLDFVDQVRKINKLNEQRDNSANKKSF